MIGRRVASVLGEGLAWVLWGVGWCAGYVAVALVWSADVIRLGWSQARRGGR